MLGSARSAFVMNRNLVTLPAAVAAYNLNENTGTTAADSSGNAHTLTLNNATWTASGHTGAALTNTSATSGASTALLAPTAAITVMAWIKPLDLTSGTTRFALGFIDNGGNSDVTFFTQRADFGTSNVLQVDVRIGGSLIALNGSALTVGTWAHIAMTYDGTNLKLYKDGTIAASTTSSGTVATGDAFWVAGWNTVSPYPTNVVVDDVRVFSTALTAAQVTLAMNTPV
ncbi:MAG TPA: LamG domain-containing protein [Candidatus Saccharimonadales bacterium]|nr:LamG domain-containing protein [Candidatus Saccharimonadales bacterium]